MNLDRRLAAAASLVRPGKRVCDVGTDHGYLPVYLTEQGVYGRCTASDIHEQPLSSARETIREHGMLSQIDLVCTDGLRDIPESAAEDIVICGMGGELIARILADCPYVSKPGHRLILQPMTRAAHLRKFLCETGFTIEKEIPVSDKTHCYTVMQASYTGKILSPSPLFLAVGKIPEHPSPDAAAYIRREWMRASRIAGGMGERPQAQEVRALAQALYTLLQEGENTCLPF